MGVTFSSFYEALRSKTPYVTFFKNIVLAQPEDVLCFLQYQSARHVLVARAGTGMASFENLGINLSHDKAFSMEKLKTPNTYELIHDFVLGALERDHYFAHVVEHRGEPIGIIVLAAQRKLGAIDFNEDWLKGAEAISTYRAMARQLEKFDHICPDTEVLTPSGLMSQVHKEVVRSRRLKRAVSTIVFRVDDYENLSKNMNGLQRKNWMRALGQLLKSQSRVNDIVGRLEEGTFVVVLPHTPLDGAKIKAERLIRLVSDSHLRVGGQNLKFTLSSALNEYPRLSEDAEGLINKGAELISAHKDVGGAVLVTGTRPHFQADFDVES